MDPGNYTSLTKECYIWVSVSQQAGVACIEIRVGVKWICIHHHSHIGQYNVWEGEWSLFRSVSLTQCVFINRLPDTVWFYKRSFSFTCRGRMGFKGWFHQKTHWFMKVFGLWLLYCGNVSNFKLLLLFTTRSIMRIFFQMSFCEIYTAANILWPTVCCWAPLNSLEFQLIFLFLSKSPWSFLDIWQPLWEK